MERERRGSARWNASSWRARDGRERCGRARDGTRAAEERAMDASGGGAREREQLESARWNASSWGARDGRERRGSARWTRAVGGARDGTRAAGERAMERERRGRGAMERERRPFTRTKSRRKTKRSLMENQKAADRSCVENSGWFGPRKFKYQVRKEARRPGSLRFPPGSFLNEKMLRLRFSAGEANVG